jgi:Glycosyltransferase WbsX
VRASGRQLFVMADTEDPRALELADSLYTFGNNLLAADIHRYSQRQSLMTRTFHLLGTDRARQRLGIVTVTPGYDESGLRDRSAPHLVVDRQGGEFYEAQWRAAVVSGADWVLVSTWNEWWENTHIEPSQRYGESYLWRTRFWSAVFKKSARVDPTIR